ncbi:glycosyltransferase family 2 protein [Paenibacillus sp. Mc5Re-14]|uniref:glycosyltransferase family 2 protein n=1 Tax=Paenibacillus sp. Mc5Re-14 TaxID=1030529 RepID=UPI000B1615F1|nr:glycosyltransferase [Paenibacillus sp. Mc5Re-14]
MNKLNQLASVIIPTKNGGDIFKKVLVEVLNQDLGAPFEIVIVDSGSSDGTVEFIQGLQNQNENILLKQIMPKEFGHGKTRNLGASLASGKYLVFITQDALPYDQFWLKNLVSCFDLDESIVGVFGRHLPYDDCDIFEKHNIITHFNNFGTETTIYYLDDQERYNREEGYRHLLCYYSDNSSAMRKEIWNTIPYPEVDFAEDQLWARQIIERGYKKAYSPQSVVYHSHNYTFKQQFKRYYDEYKGLYHIYNYASVKSVFLLPAYIAKHFISDVRFLRHNTNISRKRKLYWAAYSLVKNTVRYSGAYLGVLGNKYTSLNRLFSREYKLINK